MAQINSDEITGLIKEQIKQYDYSLSMEETGIVVEVGDGIARVFGLEDVMYNEIIKFPSDINGLAMNLEEDNVGAVLFGSDEKIKEGDEVKRTGKVLQTSVGEELLGRIVDPLGNPKDDKGPLETEKTRNKSSRSRRT